MLNRILLQLATDRIKEADAKGVHHDQPSPPLNLRPAEDLSHTCLTCHFSHIDPNAALGDNKLLCQKYKYKVDKQQICDSWQPKPFEAPPTPDVNPGAVGDMQFSSGLEGIAVPKMAEDITKLGMSNFLLISDNGDVTITKEGIFDSSETVAANKPPSDSVSSTPQDDSSQSSTNIGALVSGPVSDSESKPQPKPLSKGEMMLRQKYAWVKANEDITTKALEIVPNFNQQSIGPPSDIVNLGELPSSSGTSATSAGMGDIAGYFKYMRKRFDKVWPAMHNEQHEWWNKYKPQPKQVIQVPPQFSPKYANLSIKDDLERLSNFLLKQSAPRWVKEVQQGHLSPEAIKRVASTLPRHENPSNVLPGQFRTIGDPLGRGAFNLASKVVANVGDKPGVMVRKQPIQQLPISQQEYYQPLVNASTELEGIRPGVHARYVAATPKGIFQEYGDRDISHLIPTTKQLYPEANRELPMIARASAHWSREFAPHGFTDFSRSNVTDKGLPIDFMRQGGRGAAGLEYVDQPHLPGVEEHYLNQPRLSQVVNRHHSGRPMPAYMTGAETSRPTSGTARSTPADHDVNFVTSLSPTHYVPPVERMFDPQELAPVRNRGIMDRVRGWFGKQSNWQDIKAPGQYNTNTDLNALQPQGQPQPQQAPLPPAQPLTPPTNQIGNQPQPQPQQGGQPPQPQTTSGQPIQTPSPVMGMFPTETKTQDPMSSLFKTPVPPPQFKAAMTTNSSIVDKLVKASFTPPTLALADRVHAQAVFLDSINPVQQLTKAYQSLTKSSDVLKRGTNAMLKLADESWDNDPNSIRNQPASRNPYSPNFNPSDVRGEGVVTKTQPQAPSQPPTTPEKPVLESSGWGNVIHNQSRPEIVTDNSIPNDLMYNGRANQPTAGTAKGMGMPELSPRTNQPIPPPFNPAAAAADRLTPQQQRPIPQPQARPQPIPRPQQPVQQQPQRPMPQPPKPQMVHAASALLHKMAIGGLDSAMSNMAPVVGATAQQQQGLQQRPNMTPTAAPNVLAQPQAQPQPQMRAIPSTMQPAPQQSVQRPSFQPQFTGAAPAITAPQVDASGIRPGATEDINSFVARRRAVRSGQPQPPVQNQQPRPQPQQAQAPAPVQPQQPILKSVMGKPTSYIQQTLGKRGSLLDVVAEKAAIFKLAATQADLDQAKATLARTDPSDPEYNRLQGNIVAISQQLGVPVGQQATVQHAPGSPEHSLLEAERRLASVPANSPVAQHQQEYDRLRGNVLMLRQQLGIPGNNGQGSSTEALAQRSRTNAQTSSNAATPATPQERASAQAAARARAIRRGTPPSSIPPTTTPPTTTPPTTTPAPSTNQPPSGMGGVGAMMGGMGAGSGATSPQPLANTTPSTPIQPEAPAEPTQAVDQQAYPQLQQAQINVGNLQSQISMARNPRQRVMLQRQLVQAQTQLGNMPNAQTYNDVQQRTGHLRRPLQTPGTDMKANQAALERTGQNAANAAQAREASMSGPNPYRSPNELYPKPGQPPTPAQPQPPTTLQTPQSQITGGVGSTSGVGQSPTPTTPQTPPFSAADVASGVGAGLSGGLGAAATLAGSPPSQPPPVTGGGRPAQPATGFRQNPAGGGTITPTPNPPGKAGAGTGVPGSAK